MPKWKKRRNQEKIENFMWFMYFWSICIFSVIITDIHWADTGVRHNTKAILQKYWVISKKPILMSNPSSITQQMWNPGQKTLALGASQFSSKTLKYGYYEVWTN